MNTLEVPPRRSRYAEIISEDWLSKPVIVIGVGAIGRQVALNLAQIGVSNLELIDPDTVSDVNLGSQGWSPSEVGRLKVVALKETITQ